MKFSEQHRLHTNYEKQVGVNEQFSPHYSKKQFDFKKPPIPPTAHQDQNNGNVVYFKEENIVSQIDQLQVSISQQRHRLSDYSKQSIVSNQGRQFKSLPTSQKEISSSQVRDFQNQQQPQQQQFQAQPIQPQLNLQPQSQQYTLTLAGQQNQNLAPTQTQQFIPKIGVQIQNQSPTQQPQVPQYSASLKPNDELLQKSPSQKIQTDVDHIQEFPLQVLPQQQSSIRYYAKSKPGELCTKQPKTNQDSYFIAEHFCSQLNSYLFMVLDGHGDNGHYVSNYAQTIVYQLLENYFSPIFSQKLQIDNQVVASGFTYAFKEAEIYLIQSGIDISMSGTTVVVLLIIEKNLWCANLGDSRAVILILLNQSATQQSIYELSQDHKPENPSEFSRIRSSGGRVSPIRNQFGQPVGPHRVWAKHFQYPGLAMSRSLGDQIAHSVGVLSVPDIVGHQIGPDDYFIILGSDGLWDQIEKSVVSQIVFQMHKDQVGISTIAEHLVTTSNFEWQKLEDAIDDITCLIIQLKD